MASVWLKGKRQGAGSREQGMGMGGKMGGRRVRSEKVVRQFQWIIAIALLVGETCSAPVNASVVNLSTVNLSAENLSTVNVFTGNGKTVVQPQADQGTPNQEMPAQERSNQETPSQETQDRKQPDRKPLDRKPLDRKQIPPIRQRVVCPTDVKPLATLLVRDLPSYINRLSHQQKGSQAGFYAIASSQPDFNPLPVVFSGFPSTNKANDETLHQVFFTVLERQYDTKKAQEFQHHHWLFLAHSDRTKWQLVTLYSRRSSHPALRSDDAQGANQPITSPMQETSKDVIGRAIRLWLRDCEASAVGN